MNNKRENMVKKTKKGSLVKKLSKSKVFVGLCITTLLVMGVSAFYFFTYDKTITGYIIGGDVEKISITFDTLADYTLNVTEDTTTYQNLTLLNTDGSKQILKNLTLTRINNDLSCLNFDTDCSVELINSTNDVLPDTFTLKPGSNPMSLRTICDYRSCPQNISIELELTEI